ADDGAAADGDVRRRDALDVGAGCARREEGAGGGGGGAEQEASAGAGELGGCRVVHAFQGTGRGIALRRPVGNPERPKRGVWRSSRACLPKGVPRTRSNRM